MAANTEGKLRSTLVFFFLICQDFNALIHSEKQSSKLCMSSGLGPQPSTEQSHGKRLDDGRSHSDLGCHSGPLISSTVRKGAVGPACALQFLLSLLLPCVLATV